MNQPKAIASGFFTWGLLLLFFAPSEWTASEKVVYWGGQSSTWNFWSHVSGCPWWIRRMAISPIPCGLMASQRSKPAAWRFLPEHDAQMAGSCGWFYWCLLLGFPHVLREELVVLVQVKSSKHTIDSIRDDADWCSWDSFVAEYLSKCKAFGTTMLCYV